MSRRRSSSRQGPLLRNAVERDAARKTVLEMERNRKGRKPEISVSGRQVWPHQNYWLDYPVFSGVDVGTRDVSLGVLRSLVQPQLMQTDLVSVEQRYASGISRDVRGDILSALSEKFDIMTREAIMGVVDLPVRRQNYLDLALVDQELVASWRAGTITEICEDLVGQCIFDVGHLVEERHLVQLTREEEDRVDGEVFLCEECGWWCSADEYSSNSEGLVCDECAARRGGLLMAAVILAWPRHFLHGPWCHTNDEESDRCQACVLSLCLVCGGAEATLPSECPGRDLTNEEEDAIEAQRLDYEGGQWRVLDTKPKEYPPRNFEDWTPERQYHENCRCVLVGFPEEGSDGSAAD